MSAIMYVKLGCPCCQAVRENLAAQGETVAGPDPIERPVG
jgi:hypothetical protein